MNTTPMPAQVQERLRLAAESLARYRFEGWFYGDSIGFEGLLAASRLLGDQRWFGFADGFARGWATRRQPFRELDNTAPGRAMCRIAERATDEVLLRAARDLADYLSSRPAIGDGAWVSFARAPLKEPYGGGGLGADEAALLKDPGPGVYIDCLHFDPPFFVHLGRLLGDVTLVDAGVAQAHAYITMLQDPGSGLFHHFWLERTGRPYALGWSRGQGWALLGLLDVLEEIADSHPGRPAILRAARALAAAMVRYQRPGGEWDAVAQAPDSGTEGSTAAFMAAGLRRGVDAGWLDGGTCLPAAEAAWQATIDAVDEVGMLRDVSAAVWSSTADAHYHHVPKGFTVPWGQGPLLVAAERWLDNGDTTSR
jgi:unsaturated rhamnogalacturonyl hydrolase